MSPSRSAGAPQPSGAALFLPQSPPDASLAVAELRTLKRQLARVHDPREPRLRLVFFEWPAVGAQTVQDALFETLFPGEHLPNDKAPGWLPWRATVNQRLGLEWAYQYCVYVRADAKKPRAGASRATHHEAIFRGIERTLRCEQRGTSWPAVVAEIVDPDERTTWGRWARCAPETATRFLARRKTKGRRTVDAPEDQWAALSSLNLGTTRLTRVIPQRRGLAVPQVSQYGDFGLASLLALDKLIARAASVAKRHARPEPGAPLERATGAPEGWLSPAAEKAWECIQRDIRAGHRVTFEMFTIARSALKYRGWPTWSPRKIKTVFAELLNAGHLFRRRKLYFRSLPKVDSSMQRT